MHDYGESNDCTCIGKLCSKKFNKRPLYIFERVEETVSPTSRARRTREREIERAESIRFDASTSSTSGADMQAGAGSARPAFGSSALNNFTPHLVKY